MTEMEKEFWQRRLEYRKGGNQQSIWRLLLLLFLFPLCFYIGFTASGFFIEQPDFDYLTKDDLHPAGDSDFNLFDQESEVILLVGADSRATNDTGRSDTIMLAFLDKENKKIKLLSVLRDTYVTIPNSGEKTKINHSYAYGGIPLLESTLETNLGITVDHYVQVDFEGFASLIDALGGVTIDVEKDMRNDSENINLKKGVQTLNGQEALGYVRWRSDALADVSRVQRQQKFMKAVLEEVAQTSTLWKLPSLVNIFNNNVKTDMSTMQMLSIANTYRTMSEDAIETYSLPGTPQTINGISYWIPDQEQCNTLLEYLVGSAEESSSNEEKTPTSNDKE